MGFLISDALAAVPEVTTAASSMENTSFMLMMVATFAIFYFLIIRPQSKRAKEHRDLVSKIKLGDEIATASGILGEITKLDEQFVTLLVAPNVEMVLQRQAIGNVLPKGTLNTIKKA